MDTFALTATARKNEEKPETLRAQGQIPANIYGRGFKNQSVSVDLKTFSKVRELAGETSIIDLNVGQENYKVLIQEVQENPVSEEVLHVDFLQVRLDEKVKAEVPIKFIGEAPAIKTQGAVLNEALETVHVEALPQDLIQEIEVDLSILENLGDKIYVKDLKLSDTITITSNPDVLIVGAEEPRLKQEKEEKTPEELEKEALEAQGGDEEKKEGGEDEKEGDKKEDKPEEKKE